MGKDQEKEISIVSKGAAAEKAAMRVFGSLPAEKRKWLVLAEIAMELNPKLDLEQTDVEEKLIKLFKRNGADVQGKVVNDVISAGAIAREMISWTPEYGIPAEELCMCWSHLGLLAHLEHQSRESGFDVDSYGGLMLMILAGDHGLRVVNKTVGGFSDKLFGEVESENRFVLTGDGNAAPTVRKWKGLGVLGLAPDLSKAERRFMNLNEAAVDIGDHVQARGVDGYILEYLKVQLS